MLRLSTIESSLLLICNIWIVLGSTILSFFCWLELLAVKLMNTSFVPVDCIASLEYYIHNMRAVTGLLLLGQNNSLDLNYTPFGIPDYTEQNNIGNQTLKPPDIE